MEKLTPTAEQEKAIQRMVAEPTRSALNGSTMGAGKTLTGVEVAKRINAQTILLIAPLGTRLGWKVTFERQGVTLPFHWLNSTKAGKESMAEWEWQTPGIYFVGVEYFTRLGWDGKKRTATWSKVPDLVMFDEVHRAQNRASKTAKTLKQVKAGYKMAMSGTPTGNSFEGAWTISKWLWNDLVPNSYWEWVGKWCATVYDHFAPNNIKIVGEKQPGAFFNSMPCYVRMESELKTDLDNQLVYVELSATQRKAYTDLQKNMITWIQENPLVVEFPITLRARLRQATLGMFQVSDTNEVSFAENCKSSKIEAMFDIIDNEFDGESALILTDSRKFADVVVARLRSAGHIAEAWHGEVSQNMRESAKQKFIDGEVKYIVAVISAIAEGVDGLQFGTRNIIWLSRSDNRLLNEQAIKRIHRHGQTETVRSRDIVALDTYDLGVLSSQVDEAIKMNKILKEKEKTNG